MTELQHKKNEASSYLANIYARKLIELQLGKKFVNISDMMYELYAKLCRTFELIDQHASEIKEKENLEEKGLDSPQFQFVSFFEYIKILSVIEPSQVAHDVFKQLQENVEEVVEEACEKYYERVYG